MPKAEIGSVKDIGKRIKAKGLQKLKFYCQMCSKQCRDANGFKCHLTSDSHLRQMKIFSENAVGYMDSYSKEFEKMFLDTLRMRHSTAKVNANNVYQEVIRDKHHIHMNSTIWASLSDFCKYLGKVGKCIVEETERGWYISYIERDMTKIARQEAYQQRLELEKDAENALQQRIEVQRIEAAKLLDQVGGAVHIEPTRLLENNNDGGDSNNYRTIKQVQLALHVKPKKPKSNGIVPLNQLKSVFGEDDDNDDEDDNKKEHQGIDKDQQQPRLPIVSELPSTNVIQHQQQPSKLLEKERKSIDDDDNINSSYEKKRSYSESKEKDNKDMKGNRNVSHSHKKSKNKHSQTDEVIDDKYEADDRPWLYRDIIVRIVTKKLTDGKYFRRKAVVDNVHDDGYTAEVTVDDDDDNDDETNKTRKKKNNVVVIRIDQDDLETVAPKHSGEAVRIVRGKYKGKRATVIELDKKHYSAVLKLKDGTVVDRIDFDDFSKIA